MDKSDYWNSEEKRHERKARLNSLKQKGGEKKPIRKTGKFARIFLPILAVVLVLALGVYAAIQFAIPQKLFPPMSIAGKTVGSAEFGYYYYTVLSNLSIDRTTDEGKKKLGTLCTVEGYQDKTWRDYAYDLTAQQIVKTRIQYDLAAAAGMKLDADQITQLDTLFENIVKQQGSKVAADKYLMDLFGKGVTMATLRPVLEEASLAGNYQTKTLDETEVTEDEIAAEYEANKNNYDAVTFRLTYFAIDAAADATDEETAAADADAKAKAEEFLSKVTDSASFKTLSAEKTAAEELAAYNAMSAEDKAKEDASKADEAKAEKDLTATMTAAEKKAYDTAKANTDQTIIYAMAKSDVDSASADLGTWLFDASRAEGDSSAFKIGTGYYAIYFVSRDTSYHLPSVRQILISPNADKNVSNGDTFTADEWTAARKKAEDLLAQCTTEDKFKALVADNTDDPGSSSTEGLYEDIELGKMVQTFTDWVYDPARKAGDTGIVRSEYGFHIMWFIGYKDSTSLSKNSDTIKTSLAQGKYDEMIAAKEALDTYKYKINPFGVKLTDLG